MGRPWVPGPAVAAALLLALIPLAVDGYPIRLLTLVFQWAAMAGAWNLTAGYAGALDLGPVAPYGIGAFTVAVLMTRAGWGFLPSLVAAAAFGAAAAYVMGRPTFRLRGAYFAVGTLALAEAIKQLLLSWDRVTGVPLFGGSAGISLPLGPGPVFFYYVMGAVMAGVVAVSYSLEVSAFGYGLRAIRDSEAVAAATGVDVPALKRRVYMLGAAFLAMTGGTAAYWLSYVNAADTMAPSLTLQTIAIALLGGMGTPLGPVVGAAVLVGAQDVLGAAFTQSYWLVLGVIITAAALFFPAGIVGAVRAVGETRAARPAPPGQGRG